ncbi:hypothetical protein [Parachitinimonas caeni]|uniref:Uncharacterized protein n=1 Tax=Parachitinimonas caeni TaxID=3031301 RepID=A0ABT7DVH8_9NEIS|nr:hypothetical protein [Parachitinimonas caeni]MDK2124069.1 hypothetical protein [Parachitinimonas caeni]
MQIEPNTSAAESTERVLAFSQAWELSEEILEQVAGAADCVKTDHGKDDFCSAK